MSCFTFVGILLSYFGFITSIAFITAESPQGYELGTLPNGNTQFCLNLKCPDLPPRTCRDVKTEQPRAVATLSDGLEVLCDTQTDGGGWIVIQRRVSSDVDFYRNWTDYKFGFGNLTGNFWFGNEKIHRLTFQRRYELRVDLTLNNSTYFAVYSHFRVFGEAEKYQLDVNGYSGTAGDSLTHHNGKMFSTRDRDNDEYSGSCSDLYHGAWWYVVCHLSNLNGLWGSTKYGEGLNWQSATTYYKSATSSEMKIRPIY